LNTATLDGNGGASYTNITLAVGWHSVTVTYSGDDNFNSATSAQPPPPGNVEVDQPFVLQTMQSSGTVAPGGSVPPFNVSVMAAFQTKPLVYAAMTCTPPPGTAITCSITCPQNLGPGIPCALLSPSQPATVAISTSGGSAPPPTSPCAVMSDFQVAAPTIVSASITRSVPPAPRRDYRSFLAVLSGLGGVGLAGLVFIPGGMRRIVAGGILFLLIVILCFGTSCAGSFAPGISAPPVNNTFYISVNSELREQIGGTPSQCRTLGLQQFWFTLVIK
jgi:hypothetical protein